MNVAEPVAEVPASGAPAPVPAPGATPPADAGPAAERPADASRPVPPPGARRGPYDPDPDVTGNEVPDGGWEDAGVIYDATGEVYGCASGGNDCMGPPVGVR